MRCSSGFKCICIFLFTSTAFFAPAFADDAFSYRKDSFSAPLTLPVWDRGLYTAYSYISAQNTFSQGSGFFYGLSGKKRTGYRSFSWIYEWLFSQQRFSTASDPVEIGHYFGSGYRLNFPLAFTWSLYYNGGRLRGEVGQLNPFLGLGLSLSTLNALDTGDESARFYIPSVLLGLEYLLIPPFISLRVKLDYQWYGSETLNQYIPFLNWPEEYGNAYSIQVGWCVYVW